MSPEASKKLTADRLDRALSGEGLEWWIYSAFPKDGWIARKRGDLTHADHPGTAIRLGDEVFEIVAAEETAAPGYMVRYGLARWLSEHAIRRVILYTPEAREQAAADYLEEVSKQSLRARILWLFPLAGMGARCVAKSLGGEDSPQHDARFGRIGRHHPVHLYDARPKFPSAASSSLSNRLIDCIVRKPKGGRPGRLWEGFLDGFWLRPTRAVPT